MCSGGNVDDAGDYRPGLKAAADHGVRHPLQEADFTKADVRVLAQHWRSPTWDKPASPCLSSRLALAWRSPRNEPPVSSRPSCTCAAWVCATAACVCTSTSWRIEVPDDAVARLADPAVRAPLIARLRELGFATSLSTWKDSAPAA
ncbi:MAG: hypothetical protein U0736_02265 [Gemmataceae bacterium]